MTNTQRLIALGIVWGAIATILILGDAIVYAASVTGAILPCVLVWGGVVLTKHFFKFSENIQEQKIT